MRIQHEESRPQHIAGGAGTYMGPLQVQKSRKRPFQIFSLREGLDIYNPTPLHAVHIDPSCLKSWIFDSSTGTMTRSNLTTRRAGVTGRGGATVSLDEIPRLEGATMSGGVYQP